MRDRFRFRVWDNFVGCYSFRSAGNDALYPTNKQVFENTQRWVIEQCTGLKDKNGRLIYEGDIIRHDTAAGPKCWPVVFKNGCFVLPYESGDAWLGKVIEHCPYDSGVVVVGNIHENPELLEGRK